MRRFVEALSLVGISFALLGAAPPEQQEMLGAFDEALTAMAYAASGLCVFSIVWAGFILMAEGSEERGGGKAKTAVVTAVVGLVLALSAKAVSIVLLAGIVPMP